MRAHEGVWYMYGQKWGGYKGILLVLVIIASDSANIAVIQQYTLLNRKYYFIISCQNYTVPLIAHVNYYLMI